MSVKNKISVHRALSFMLLNELMKKNNQTDAFKMGLIDSKGDVVRMPTTEEEQLALTSFVLITVELKKLLGSKLSSLYRFMYVNNYDSRDILDKLMLRTNIENRISIRRIEHDISKMFMEGVENSDSEIKK